MPKAVLVVKYRFNNGKEHQYVFGVKSTRGGSSNQPIDQQFINAVYGSRLMVGDTSVANSIGPDLSRSLAEAVLSFLSHLSQPPVTFTKLYLSDGVTPGPGTGEYAVVPLNFSAHGNALPYRSTDPAQTAPGNQTLMLGKKPALVGLRPGHQWIRYALRKDTITTGPDDETSFASSGFASIYRDAVSGAEGQSTIATFYPGRQVGTEIVYFGQLQFYSKAELLNSPGLKGAIKAVQAITDMQLIDAQNRQAKRGRKKAVSATRAAEVLAAHGVALTPEQQAALNAKLAPAPPVIIPPGPTPEQEQDASDNAKAYETYNEEDSEAAWARIEAHKFEQQTEENLPLP